MDHIHHLIKNCIRYSKDIHNVTVILLSIWFHDIIYDPTKHNNEVMSIQVFNVFIEHLMKNFGDNIYKMLTKEMIQKVIDYIDATIKHQIKKEYIDDKDIEWFLDFDLAILGEQEDIYQLYMKNIRKEYIHVQSPMFEQKRSEVMRRFLNREQLYFSNEFIQKFENIARQNVANEIQMLEKQ